MNYFIMQSFWCQKFVEIGFSINNCFYIHCTYAQSYILHTSVLVAAAKIRDHETGLVSGPFWWFQSHQIFYETHETEAKPIFSFFTNYLFWKLHVDPRFCIKSNNSFEDTQFPCSFNEIDTYFVFLLMVIELRIDSYWEQIIICLSRCGSS